MEFEKALERERQFGHFIPHSLFIISAALCGGASKEGMSVGVFRSILSSGEHYIHLVKSTTQVSRPFERYFLSCHFQLISGMTKAIQLSVWDEESKLSLSF